MKFFLRLIPVFPLLLVFSCTPKVAEQVASAAATEQPAETQPAASAEMKSNCPTFADAPNEDEIIEQYVLYRDFLKVGDWDMAFDYWQKVYSIAPGADGQRNTVMADGITFYEHFLAQAEDPAQKNEYIDKIFSLYDQITECYPEGGYIEARKGFDLYYKYKDRTNSMEIYELFKASIEKDGAKTNDFVVNPFTALMIDLFFEDRIPVSEVKKYFEIINELIANGLAECEGVACDRWQIVKEYAPARLEAFEVVEGFFDCEYYMDKYYQDFLDATTDCDVIRTVYSRLKWGGCPETDERFRNLIQAGNQNCVEESDLQLAYQALRDADYNKAIELFQSAADEEERIEKKATYILLIAKIYNAHLKDFSKARQYALQAAGLRADWGEPYILIGRLYASSGPLCGPGRGWDSQIVVWPAIDMWAKAKNIDSSVAEEANKWINTYRKFMPTKEDVFIRNLKVGQSFRVGCWIQENTVIRTVD